MTTLFLAKLCLHFQAMKTVPRFIKVPKKPKFQNSEYAGQKFGSKDSVSQNLCFVVSALGVAKISVKGAFFTFFDKSI
jgi:hypothetical protein